MAARQLRPQWACLRCRIAATEFAGPTSVLKRSFALTAQRNAGGDEKYSSQSSSSPLDDAADASSSSRPTTRSGRSGVAASQLKSLSSGPRITRTVSPNDHPRNPQPTMARRRGTNTSVGVQGIRGGLTRGGFDVPTDNVQDDGYGPADSRGRAAGGMTTKRAVPPSQQDTFGRGMAVNETRTRTPGSKRRTLGSGPQGRHQRGTSARSTGDAAFRPAQDPFGSNADLEAAAVADADVGEGEEASPVHEEAMKYAVDLWRTKFRTPVVYEPQLPTDFRPLGLPGDAPSDIIENRLRSISGRLSFVNEGGAGGYFERARAKRPLFFRDQKEKFAALENHIPTELKKENELSGHLEPYHTMERRPARPGQQPTPYYFNVKKEAQQDVNEALVAGQYAFSKDVTGSGKEAWVKTAMKQMQKNGTFVGTDQNSFMKAFQDLMPQTAATPRQPAVKRQQASTK